MKKTVLMDGAVGTSLWAKADERGIKKDPIWTYNITHPELVTELAKEYVDAGAKLILANTRYVTSATSASMIAYFFQLMVTITYYFIC